MQHLKRLALLADDEITPYPSKTLIGMLRYRPDHVLTIIDSRNTGRDAGDVAGLGHGIEIVKDVAAALELKPDALLLADEPVGAALQAYWREQILLAIEAGIDVINGMHYHLTEDEGITQLAARTGSQLWDLRKPPQDRYFTELGPDGRPIVDFRPHRAGSRTVLAVGTDCSSGKMTTMLEVERAAKARGLAPSFVATGQVGMMISGGGVAVDGIMADFVNATVEDVVFKATEQHDLVLVEGQGALNHPRYSAVTLGLLHGSRPDSMILCHELGRTSIGLLDYPLPSLTRAIEINEQAAQWIWPGRRCTVAGISVMTGSVSESQARAALARIEAETGLPATDVVRFGPERLLDAILSGPVLSEPIPFRQEA